MKNEWIEQPPDLKDIIPIRIIHFDPVTRQIVEPEKDYSGYGYCLELNQWHAFDLSYVTMPADRIVYEK